MLLRRSLLLQRVNLPIWARQSSFRPFSAARLTDSPLHYEFQGPSLSTSASPFMKCRFSTDAHSKLLDILSREEREEYDSGNMEMPEELAELKTSLEINWRMVDDGATTQLFLQDKKVQLSFHCQDTIEEQTYDDDIDDDEEPVSAVRFTVTLSKAGRTLVFNCLSEFGLPKIEGVATTASTPDAVHGNQGVIEKVEYQGPDFLELAEDLQEAMGIFLEEECNVNSDVAAFVAMYADYKEQLQYAQFLKDCRSIIA